jgi:hypothetical protein
MRAVSAVGQEANRLVRVCVKDTQAFKRENVFAFVSCYPRFTKLFFVHWKKLCASALRIIFVREIMSSMSLGTFKNSFTNASFRSNDMPSKT